MRAEIKINYFLGAFSASILGGLLPITNNSCRHARADRHGRQIRRDHCSRSNHGAITDRDSCGYHDIGPKPHIIADSDRCILSRLTTNQLTTSYAMIGRDDRGAGAEQHIASYDNWASGGGPYRAEVIEKGVVADLDHLRVFEEHGRRNLDSLAYSFQLCLAQVIASRDEGE
jgi:hypothetical protein